MNKRTKVGFIALSLVLVAVVALVGFSLGRGGPTGAVQDTAGIRGQVEWSVYDAAGNLKQSYVNHNAVVTLGLNDARTRLGDATALTLGAATAYDDIALLSTNSSGAAGTIVPTVRLDVGNPVSSAYTALAESGNYSVTKTFVVTAGIDVTVEELQLAKNTTAGTAPTATEIGAWQNVTITLAGTDSIAVTWTIDID